MSLNRKITASLTAAIIVAAGVVAVPNASVLANTPTCTLNRQTGEKLIHFSGKTLFANRSGADSVDGPKATNIPAGTYKVTLQSYDNHSQKPNSNQKMEKWYLMLRNNQTQHIGNTGTIGDLPENTDHMTQVVNTSLVLSERVRSVIARHAAYPASGPESITPICALFEPVATPTPTPTPTITPSPTPTATPTPTTTPTPTPTPTPEDPDDEDEGDEPSFGVAISKTDHRDITRPGHTLTYEIVVENTGDAKISDLEVTDVVPSALTITSVSGDGHIEGQKVTWGEFALGDDEEVTLFITATVKSNTSSGHTLTNTVKVRSEDEGISANDTDTTVVERQGQVAATTTVAPEPIPVTAKTGAGPIGLLATLLGGTGLTLVRRYWS